METLTIGVSGNKLANKDFFSKSDPYLVISRPVPGGWNPLRSSKTIKVIKEDESDTLEFKACFIHL